MMKQSDNDISYWMIEGKNESNNTGIFLFILVGIEQVHYRAEKDTWRW